MINVTDMAAAKFKEYAAQKENPDAQMLRITLQGAGWSGPQLGLALEELKKLNDTVVESNGTKIIFNKDLGKYVSTLTLDYLDKWYNKGFRLTGDDMGSC